VGKVVPPLVTVSGVIECYRIPVLDDTGRDHGRIAIGAPPYLPAGEHSLSGET
jgi:hypothetical protein